MKKVLLTAALAALAAAGAARASAELVIETLSWQEGRPARPPRPPVFSDSASSSLARKPAPRLRGKAVLTNRGALSVEGIVLRYSLAARILSASPGANGGEWEIPFLIDERRVPKLAAGATVEVPLIVSPMLEQHVKKLSRHGRGVDRLRLEVMVEPHGPEPVKTHNVELELLP